MLGQLKNIFQEDKVVQEALDTKGAQSSIYSTLQVYESDQISRIVVEKSKSRHVVNFRATKIIG